MGVRQFTKQTRTSPLEVGTPEGNPERCLTLLIDGAALNVPEVDADGYQIFRANVARLSQQMPDRLPQEEKLALIRAAEHEFETYRVIAETTLREGRRAGECWLRRCCTNCWRISASGPHRRVQARCWGR